jgi:hypothetical protein
MGVWPRRSGKGQPSSNPTPKLTSNTNAREAELTAGRLQLMHGFSHTLGTAHAIYMEYFSTYYKYAIW